MSTGRTPEMASLRPYAVDPPLDDWSFPSASSSARNPPKSSGSSIRPQASSASAAAGIQFTSDIPPGRGRYAPVGPPQSMVAGLEGTDDGRPFRPSDAINIFVYSASISYASVAAVMPFEVAKLLLQIQWVPKDDQEIVTREIPGLDEGADWQARDEQELHTEEETEAYFADLTTRPFAASFHGSIPPDYPLGQHGTGALSPRRSKPDRDPAGYIIRRSIYDENLRPDYVLPARIDTGVWDMCKALGGWQPEGWSSLWKGLFTTWASDVLESFMHPVISTICSTAFNVSGPLASLPLVHTPYPARPLAVAVGAYTLTTVLLSPLDLVRTRLIAQSAQVRHKKYSGLVDAFQTISREEGGYWGMFMHSQLLLPTVISGVVRSLLQYGGPLLIERWLGISPTENPVAFLFLEMAVSTAGLLITLPIETIRRRLQIQSRSPTKPAQATLAGPVPTLMPYRACVEIRPTPYVGMIDAAWRIATEETGKFPSNQSKSIASVGLSSSGVAQLYRGFTIGLGFNATVVLLGLITGKTGTAEWSEM
ncbi:uncharacterized protein L969DRAFT_55483 [Mixia osmundae IAM 14324]|uniref:Mitochondrial carrier n=1 Tax=Mixia osmundae (strain CBS 9802 / IAM 14324 / JCM 22182 / KY 12970) TaxID=764103 RepID=G7E4F0_MIXOS|nr:uncharacterized protein L969DRAFT_55483 [Mixia osmundae IAM 14324]KEI36272.1 hypothetical protein L969DRAFT_55483 [Mixia osmundae IAM 14324]GAA97710.1 hypothetical protein E5Q_04389 [Mixia osmundae IAM 14324]